MRNISMENREVGQERPVNVKKRTKCLKTAQKVL
jgi:hypothetical protein